MTQLTVTAANWRALPTAGPARGAGKIYLYTLWQSLSSVGFVGGALGLPLLMYFIFGYGKDYSHITVGNGTVQTTILVMMTTYGALNAAIFAGCSNTMERRSGWWRTLALTPLHLGAYLAMCLAATITLDILLTVVLFGVGIATGATLPLGGWLSCLLLIQLCCVGPAALGLALGQLLSDGAAYSLASLTMVVGAFLSGMFLPLDQMGDFIQKLAPYTPLYGVAKLVGSPIYGWAEHFQWDWVINIVVWTAAFIALAAWALTRPARTAR